MVEIKDQVASGLEVATPLLHKATGFTAGGVKAYSTAALASTVYGVDINAGVRSLASSAYGDENNTGVKSLASEYGVDINTCGVALATGLVVGGGAMVAAPLLLKAAGFTAAGIKAGSPAALCQSAGAAGISGSSYAVIGTVGTVVGTLASGVCGNDINAAMGSLASGVSGVDINAAMGSLASGVSGIDINAGVKSLASGVSGIDINAGVKSLGCGIYGIAGATGICQQQEVESTPGENDFSDKH